MSRVLVLCTFDRLLTTILFLAIGLTCGLTPIQTDTWWQLRAGQDMWNSGRVVLTDTYSHTAHGAFWANHEWLAEVIFYAIFRVGGLGSLTLFAAALIMCAWALTWRLMRGPVQQKFIWALLALPPSAVWWEPRPHAFSLLFIILTVFLMVSRRYWWLPPIFLVWANVHGGVLLGFVLLAGGAAALALTERRVPWRLLLVVLLCLAAATATPLGLSFWTEIPKSLGRIGQYTFDEWRRPGFLEVPMLPFWGIAAVFCVTLLQRWRRALLDSDLAVLCACALAMLPGAVMSVRHVGPFVMVALPAVSGLIPTREQAPHKSLERPRFNLAVMLIAVSAVALVLFTAYRNEWARLRWMPVPAKALEAVRLCEGNLYNRYDEGGYLLWFVPERKVFLDGRQDPFPPDLVLEHIEIETGRATHRGVFERYHISCAFLPVRSPVTANLERDRWTAIYRDRRWVVFRK